MCYTALLLLEVYQHVPADTGLGSLANAILDVTHAVYGIQYDVLMYALTAAYISGAGELLASSINNWFGATLSPAAGVLLFTLLPGWYVSTPLVDLLTASCLAQISFFWSSCLRCSRHIFISKSFLRFLFTAGWRYPLPSFSPRLVFTGSVPSIVSYGNGKYRRLRWALRRVAPFR